MTIRETKPVHGLDEAEFGFPSERLLVSPPDSHEAAQNIERAKILWEHRRLLGRSISAGILIGVALVILLPVRYTSTVRLMPPDQNFVTNTGMQMFAALTTKAAGPFGSLGAEFLGLKTSGDLFVGILQSRTVQDAIINKMDLRKVYGLKRWEDARKRLSRRTVISEDRKSGILTIAVSDHSRETAKAMAEEYVVQLNRVVTSLNTSSARREREFLEGRLRRVNEDLDVAQKEFSQFASKNTTIDLQAQSKAMIEAGAQLAGELAAAQTELEGLRQIYSRGNVRVREVQARVDELRKQLEKLGGPSATDQSAANQPQSKDSSTLYPSIRELPILGVTYADLYRRVKVQEAVFETLTQEFELAKVQEAKETPSVKILDPADLPERNSFPPRAVMIIVAAGLAFIIGTIWVLANEHWMSIDPKHPGKQLTLEILSTVRAPWRRRLSRNGKAG